MKRLLIWAIVLVGGYLIVFGGSSTKNLDARKVTIEVETPQGTVRGSSVFELTESSAPWWYPSAVKSGIAIKGEAPFADLGRGRYVFMTLQDQLYGKQMVSYLLQRIRGSTNSSYDQTPVFVTFDSIEDANSIREVDRNAMERTFGPGYRLLSLTVTDTRERATQGTLARRFPALHAAMMAPASQRLPAPNAPPRTDLRWINWSAFDSIPRP